MIKKSELKTFRDCALPNLREVIFSQAIVPLDEQDHVLSQADTLTKHEDAYQNCEKNQI